MSAHPVETCAFLGELFGFTCPAGADTLRDYTQVVRDDRFPQGFLAVDEKTPENDGEKTYTHPGSSEPLDPLLGQRLLSDVY